MGLLFKNIYRLRSFLMNISSFKIANNFINLSQTSKIYIFQAGSFSIFLNLPSFETLAAERNIYFPIFWDTYSWKKFLFYNLLRQLQLKETLIFPSFKTPAAERNINFPIFWDTGSWKKYKFSYLLRQLQLKE